MTWFHGLMPVLVTSYKVSTTNLGYKFDAKSCNSTASWAWVDVDMKTLAGLRSSWTTLLLCKPMRRDTVLTRQMHQQLILFNVTSSYSSESYARTPHSLSAYTEGTGDRKIPFTKYESMVRTLPFTPLVIVMCNDLPLAVKVYLTSDYTAQQNTLHNTLHNTIHYNTLQDSNKHHRTSSTLTLHHALHSSKKATTHVNPHHKAW